MGVKPVVRDFLAQSKSTGLINSNSLNITSVLADVILLPDSKIIYTHDRSNALTMDKSRIG
jgi:hypothetical protein